MKQILFKIASAILVGFAVFLILNLGFIRQNLKFAIGKKNETAEIIPDKMEPNRLVIQSLKLDLPVVYADKVSENEFQKNLENGVVHYPQTALPGNFGNVYIFGHSSDYIWAKGNYKNAFATLPYLPIGEEIILSDQSGAKFVYKVKAKKVVGPEDKSVLSQFGSKQKLLTLQTSYPLGTALKRYIVVSELE